MTRNEMLKAILVLTNLCYRAGKADAAGDYHEFEVVQVQMEHLEEQIRKGIALNYS